MRTYNVITDFGDQLNSFPVSKVEANKIAKKYSKRYTISIVPHTPKFWYYRGVKVERHEDQSNGWTLVSNTDGSKILYRAATWELEYK